MASQPIIAIVGPTASGKTALALQIAALVDGEILCADSRTVYRGMDIGTAKPSFRERQQIPHHLVDVVNPDERFTVYDFQKLANSAIQDIRSRGRVPILVGGSGLYVDSVIYDYDFMPSSIKRDSRNPRHLARESVQQIRTLRRDVLIVGLEAEKDLLRPRIEKRVEDMAQGGLIDEVKRLAARYGWDIAPMQAPAYKAFRGYIEGTESLEVAKQKAVLYDTQLAKKQRTWFKRNNSIHWVTDPQDAVGIVTTQLNNYI